MAPQLRRSRRSRKTSSYRVGDIVEILRRNGVSNGRLIYKLTEGESPNPRWLVSFGDGRSKDEEMYERSFGRLVKSDGERPKRNRPTSFQGRNNGQRAATEARIDKSNSSNENNTVYTTTSSSETDEKASSKNTSGIKRAKKSVSFAEDVSPVASEASSSPAASLPKSSTSAREQRSRRRQAKIDQEATTILPTGAKRKLAMPARIKKGAASNTAKRMKRDPNEEVVVVKLLTGTLYLYRGLNRRAEFIRRY